MKRRLYAKFLGGYLIFFILGFLVIALFSARLTEEFLIHTNGEQLYTEASILAETCSSPYSGRDLDLSAAAPASKPSPPTWGPPPG